MLLVLENLLLPNSWWHWLGNSSLTIFCNTHVRLSTLEMEIILFIHGC